MRVPITDNRYFTLGVDDIVSQGIPLYDLDEYANEYPRISSTMPELFSINLRNEIDVFITKAPSQFVSDITQVIDLACYYYNDWESVIAITDEFIQTEVLDKVRDSLAIRYNGDARLMQEKIDDLIAQCASALADFIGVIVGVLTRAGVPAILDYGSSYRLDAIDDAGNVYFRIRTPTQVYTELEGGPAPD